MNRNANRASGREVRRGSIADDGFSMVEVLIAAAILLVVLLSLVPLFARAVMANATGMEYTEVSNAARGRAEEFLQYGFASPELAIQSGTERVHTDVYSLSRKQWIAEEDLGSDDVALFTRTAVIRQFGIGDLGTPLPAGTPPEAVHLKEISVSVEGLGGPRVIGPGKTIGLRVFKSQ